MSRYVALIGFMASGKSTIGQRVARKLATQFYDLDDLVAARHGAIDEIFYKAGETAFRSYEHDELERLFAESPPGIVALGGGATTYDPTRKLLKKHAYTIFIKDSPEHIHTRLRRSRRTRPLLGPAPSLHRVKELYAQRLPSYGHADFVVEADKLSAGKVGERIAEWVRQKKLQL